MIYDYARGSKNGQSVTAQVPALKDAGTGTIFKEIARGAKTDRHQLRRVIATLDAGDMLLVTRLDRLARSTRDLLNTLSAIAGREAGFRSLTDYRADTTTPHGRLMVTMFAGLTGFERDLIHARTSEGRKRAIADGVKMGRKPKLDHYRRREALKRLEAGETPGVTARTYGVHWMTIERLRS